MPIFVEIDKKEGKISIYGAGEMFFEYKSKLEKIFEEENSGAEIFIPWIERIAREIDEFYDEDITHITLPDV